MPNCAVVFVTFAMFWPAQAPVSVARDGSITGQVVDAATGKPVSAAIVRIVEGAGTPPLVSEPGLHGRAGILTGADGRFVFTDLPVGSFTLTASKSGYAEGATGRQRPDGPSHPVAITTARPAADVSVRLWKYAAISGTVTDEAGEPVVGVRVRAFQRALNAGRRRLRSLGLATVTDDRGSYRLANLVPGEYAIVASTQPVGTPLSWFADVAANNFAIGPMGGARPGQPTTIAIGDAVLAIGRGAPVPPPPVNGHAQVYPPTFHPSTLNPAQATLVTVRVGEERAGIDLHLVPVPAVRISGVVSGPGAETGTVVRLVPATTEIDRGDFEFVTGSDARGLFVFPAVTPGQYVLRSSGRTADGVFWTSLPVTVAGADIDGIAAPLKAELTIRGHLEFEGTAQPPATPRAEIAVENVEGQPASIQARTAWRYPPEVAQPAFSAGGYAAGAYLVRVTGSPTGWMFKSATLNGVDVSETPFDLTRDVNDLVLTFTDHWTGVSGRVEGATDPDTLMVIVFPSDPQRWIDYGSASRRVRSARVAADGSYGVSSLPPGEYYIVALREDEVEDWRDPKSLESFVRVATRVTILDGDVRTIDLRLREARH